MSFKSKEHLKIENGNEETLTKKRGHERLLPFVTLEMTVLA